MIVFVSMRSSDSATYVEHRDAISHDWSRFFSAVGIIPLLVPNALQNPLSLLDALPGAGLLLTGGDDIGDAPRDRTEREVLTAAIDRRLPVFGACRGLQMINVAFGGGIARRAGEGHVATEHDVDIIDSLGDCLPTGTFKVNSFHNDCVLEEELAGELRAFAMAPRGIVEGLYHPDLPITAVQWHPERVNPGHALDDLLLKRWFSQCA
jgi:N5-(cytidine 5'-diphosphoramidyl)-L-glutamine hydrolase